MPLLLFPPPISATLTASIAAQGALSGDGNTGITNLAGVGALGPLDAVEILVSASANAVGGLIGIAEGFLSGAAQDAGFGDLRSTGGFTDTIALAGLGEVTATVGTFLDGTALLDGVGAITEADTFVEIAALQAVGSVAGDPSLSGGTLTVSATMTGVGSLSATPVEVAIMTIFARGSLNAQPSLFSGAANFPHTPYFSGVGAWVTTVQDFAK